MDPIIFSEPLFDENETYTWGSTPQILVRGSDGVSIPTDAGNRDYQQFLLWQASGKTVSAFIPPPAAPRSWTPYEFYQKFTASERKALKSSTDEQVQEWVTDLQLFQVVYPDSSEFKVAMDYLVTAGVLTSDREAAIIAG